jgi:hypothetical protein
MAAKERADEELKAIQRRLEDALQGLQDVGLALSSGGSTGQLDAKVYEFSAGIDD